MVNAFRAEEMTSVEIKRIWYSGVLRVAARLD